MIDDPAGAQNPAKKNPPDKSEKEAAEKGDGKPDAAPPVPPSDLADGAAARSSAQEENASQPNLKDFEKKAAETVGQPDWVYEFMRTMRGHFGPSNHYTNYFYEGGAAFQGSTQVEGDVVGRDKSERGDRADSAVSGRLYSSEIEKTVSVYVETAAHKQAHKILSEKHILILFGDTDVGKRSAAISLLESFHQKTIFEIAPRLKELTDFDCQPRQGYLWNTPSAEKIMQLSPFALDGISSKHKDQQSHLVITLTKGARISAEVAREYLLDWNDCPDGSLVLDKHLAWHLKNESEEVKAEAGGLRQREVIGALVNDQVRRPSQAGRLAELLVQVARGELKLEELPGAFADLNRQDAQGWFERHPQLHQRLQMVALAVLHGASLRKIISASKDLLRSYLAANEMPGVESKAPPAAEAELAIGAKQWLSEFEARVVIREISAEYGRSTAEAVVFEKPMFQSAVLAYAWQELQHWRTPLFNWLVEMGESDNLEYRIAAAMALSEISQYHAFEDVLREAVSSWAKADEPGQRRLAAFILMLQGLEKGLSAQVLGLLHHWAKMSGNWRLQWTAATAYGTELGLAYPELAMRDLYEVFLTRNLVLHVSVLTTLRYLFECGHQQRDLFTVVLRTLESWARDKDLIKQNVLYIFRELLRLEVKVDNHTWPTILWLAASDKTNKRQFGVLFSAALADIEICDLLMVDLQTWLTEADKIPEMFEFIRHILDSLFKSSSANLKVARRIIADRLKQWAASGSSQSAGELLAFLKANFSI